MNALQIRLKNCIQTILDLEFEGDAYCKWPFIPEFRELKGMLTQVERMPLTEDDVCRMENAAGVFFAELRHLQRTVSQPGRLLQ